MSQSVINCWSSRWEPPRVSVRTCCAPRQSGVHVGDWAGEHVVGPEPLCVAGCPAPATGPPVGSGRQSRVTESIRVWSNLPTCVQPGSTARRCDGKEISFGGGVAGFSPTPIFPVSWPTLRTSPLVRPSQALLWPRVLGPGLLRRRRSTPPARRTRRSDGTRPRRCRRDSTSERCLAPFVDGAAQFLAFRPVERGASNNMSG